MKKPFPFRYFIVAFAWAWLWEILLLLASRGIIPIKAELVSALKLPVMVIATFGPALGAFYSLYSLDGKGSIKKYLKGLLDFRLGWMAWVLPIVILGGSTCIAWIVPELWGTPRAGMMLSSIWLFPLYYLLMILLGGGQEELGWRGYILDPMEERLGLWFANFILGVVWALWHLPLFFIPGTSQAYMNFGGFMMLTVGYCMVFSWIRQISGKRTLAGLFVHGSANAFISIFPTIITIQGAYQVRYWIWTSLTLAIGLTITAIRITMAKRTESSSGKFSTASAGI